MNSLVNYSIIFGVGGVGWGEISRLITQLFLGWVGWGGVRFSGFHIFVFPLCYVSIYFGSIQGSSRDHRGSVWWQLGSPGTIWEVFCDGVTLIIREIAKLKSSKNPNIIEIDLLTSDSRMASKCHQTLCMAGRI